MYQFPALATLIYVDWLPTGQWSAVSSIVYSRGSQISLCQHSYFVDSSNLEMAEALSGCLQLLLLLLARCMWRKPSYICLITHYNSGLMMSRPCRQRRCHSKLCLRCSLDISSTMWYLYHAIRSVIIPQIKHASSLAIAVFATLQRFPWPRTIL